MGALRVGALKPEEKPPLRAGALKPDDDPPLRTGALKPDPYPPLLTGAENEGAALRAGGAPPKPPYDDLPVQPPGE